MFSILLQNRHQLELKHVKFIESKNITSIRFQDIMYELLFHMNFKTQRKHILETQNIYECEILI